MPVEAVAELIDSAPLIGPTPLVIVTAPPVLLEVVVVPAERVREPPESKRERERESSTLATVGMLANSDRHEWK